MKKDAGLRGSALLCHLQQHWLRSDGSQATREDLMVALANLEYIIIKAKYAEDTDTSRSYTLISAW
jgi:hypothetical protein